MSRPQGEQGARRDTYRVRYGLSQRQADRLTQAKMDQLERCTTEEARRLLLFGVRYGR